MSEAILLDYAPAVAFPADAGRNDRSLFVVGLNHRTAPVEVRERLSVAEGRMSEVAESLTRLPAIDGACVLSTCNRVEVIVSSSAPRAIDAVIDWMSDHARARRDDLAPHLYILRGDEAVAHLFRVTSGLDSMILGEPQIAGQVKKAFGAGSLDATLHQLYEQTLRVAKRVRTQTGIGEHAVSVPYAAIELAKKIFGELAGLRVLLLGAGEIGELTAEHLAAQNVRQIFVANKTYCRAVELARRFDGEAVQFASFEEHLAECDIVIASTGAPHYVIEPDQVQRALDARNQRGLFLIDLAVPRNIDPAIENIDGAYLYDIDDLQQVVTVNLEARKQKAAKAEEIIAGEVDSFRRRAATSDAAPTILELRARLDEIRSAELEKCLRKLGPITLQQREAIEQFAVQMTNKILHQPIVELKKSEALRRTVRMIFGLRP